MASLPTLSVVIVAGAPCSGKGTQCKMLARDGSRYHHLSTGDLVRDLASNPSAAPDPTLAQQAKEFMDCGQVSEGGGSDSRTALHPWLPPPSLS